MKKGPFQTVLNAILLATLFVSTPLFASKLENMERVKQELVPPICAQTFYYRSRSFQDC
jgi:hypothetical protein